MKILITGGTGQVGFELQRSLGHLATVIAPPRSQLDLMDNQAVSNYLTSVKPDLIVNAAAWTAVDKAEEEPDSTYRLNADLPAQLAEYAETYNVWLIHYSSDYVYPGDGTKPWQENDEGAPLSVYGASKLKGDQLLVTSKCNYLIFRTSWVYSARGNNFMKTMLRLAKEREELAVVADQIGSPTPARLIANITAQAVANIKNAYAPAKGIYHLAPNGETSWFEFAKAIFEIAKADGIELKIRDLKPITTEQYPTPATRPLNSRLNLEKIETELSIEMPDWMSQLELTLKEYNN